MFGQLPAPVKAGDPAPDLTWTKIVASAPASGGPQNLFGYTTVLLFLRPVSHNEQTVSTWNKLVEQFADKPVNFVWIANEKEESLVPFLKDHPVRGWMALDPQEDTYKAYGVEGAGAVLIDPRGLISGFTLGTPQQEQIQAVLDGRAIAIEGDPTEAQLDAFFEGSAVRLEARPFRFRSPPPPQKPDLPPSDEVHISRSQTEGTISSTGPDHWMRRGFDLRAILSEILATSPSRVDLPAALDNEGRYDFVLVPPREEDEETMNEQVLAGIEKYFHVTITPEIRSVDAYVMTALEGKTPPRKSGDESLVSAGAWTFNSNWRPFKLPEGTAPTRKAVEEATRRAMDSPEFRQAMAMAQLMGMTALSYSMEELCRSLEDGLHRPVVDETRLAGIYDFKIQGEAQTTEEFLGIMRDQLGLVLTPTQRSIEITVVRPAE